MAEGFRETTWKNFLMLPLVPEHQWSYVREQECHWCRLGPAFDTTHSELCCISMWYYREVDPKLLCHNYRKVEQGSLCKHRWLKLSNWLRLSLYWNPWWGSEMGPPGRSRCLLKRVQAAKEQTLAVFVETYEELGNIVLRDFYSIWLK